jgi:hypothetical protein
MTDMPLSMPSGDNVLDDGERPQRGVVVTLRKVKGSSLRLALDDVIASRHAAGIAWKADTFYTHFSASLEELQEMSLSDELLRDIGFALVARLSVEFQTGESKNVGDA